MMKAYETHFELAERLRMTPARTKRLALQYKLGPYGSSGGVLYFPTAGGDMAFFEAMMRVRFIDRCPADGR